MSIMMLRLFLFLCLTDVAPVAPQDVRHDYYLITTPATWIDAQIYCRNKYVDLATVESDNDWQELHDEAASKGLAATGWVGLYLNVKDWYFSYKTQPMNFGLTFWGPGQPDNAGGNEACVAMNSNGYWEDCPCIDLKPVICYDATSAGFVAVSAFLMSWWGGQTYCRQYHTDFASVTTVTENNQLQQITSLQGSSWFGLFRDPWLWSDRSVTMRVLWNPGFPNNVDHNDNCASVNNTTLVDRQCNSLFNFFCHTPHIVRHQVVKLQIQGDKSVFDLAVQSAILQQIVQKLKEHGLSRRTTVTWRVQPDGDILHKKRIDGL